MQDFPYQYQETLDLSLMASRSDCQIKLQNLDGIEDHLIVEMAKQKSEELKALLQSEEILSTYLQKGYAIYILSSLSDYQQTKNLY